MDMDRVTLSLDDALNALAALREGVIWVEACDDLDERRKRIDAVAKRFEVLFEYLWKAVQAVTRWKGEEALSPRDAIQAAHKFGWIDDVELWAGYLQARNSGVHDYFGLGSEEYFAVASDFLPAAERLMQQLSTAVA